MSQEFSQNASGLPVCVSKEGHVNLNKSMIIKTAFATEKFVVRSSILDNLV